MDRTYSSMPEPERFTQNTVEVRVGMTNYTPKFYMHVFTYPCSNRKIGLTDLC